MTVNTGTGVRRDWNSSSVSYILGDLSQDLCIFLPPYLKIMYVKYFAKYQYQNKLFLLEVLSAFFNITAMIIFIKVHLIHPYSLIGA